MSDTAKFTQYVRETVADRIVDAESSFDSDLTALATTGMATQYVEQLLKAVPIPESWEVGEALAECALCSDTEREIRWPWNTVCDRRTPRASLPGADLVGFLCDDEDVVLLFGEVKTSWDSSTPPGVMNGGSGMAWQLEQNATRLDIQHSLLKWLHARCRSSPFRSLYERAVSKYLESSGKEISIFGVLIRDTSPNELDLRARGESLSSKLTSPTKVDLVAWYLPIPIVDWPGLLGEVES